MYTKIINETMLVPQLISGPHPKEEFRLLWCSWPSIGVVEISWTGITTTPLLDGHRGLYEEIYIHWAPTIHNPCNKHLFWVICDVWANPINHMSKVVISTPNKIPFRNIPFKFLKYFLEAPMK